MPDNRFSGSARHEEKYYVDNAELHALRLRLSKALKMDSHCVGGKPYFIRSLYFDDYADSAFYDKQAGTADRNKYRIRLYNFDDSLIFLERKRKVGDGIQKSSVRITRRLAEQLMSGDPKGLLQSGNPLLQDMYRMMRTEFLRPKVIVDYSREAYVYPVEDVRITFDLDVRTGLFSRDLFSPRPNLVCPLDDNLQILEVKYNDYLPDHIRHLLAETRAMRSAVSKYVLCRRFEPL